MIRPRLTPEGMKDLTAYDTDIAFRQEIESIPADKRPRWLKQKLHGLNVERRTKAAEIKQLEGYDNILSDGIAVLENSGLTNIADLPPHPEQLNLVKMRRNLANFAVAADENDQLLDILKTRMWFDFSLADVRAGSDANTAASFAKEMIDAGILQLPFPQCVFFTTYKNNGIVITIGDILEQRSHKIAWLGSADYMHRRKGWFGLLYEQPELSNHHALQLLSLSSHVVDVEPTSFAGKIMAAKDAPPSTSYRRVTIRPSYRGEHQGGTHASPRLHWRRGHQRHLHSGRIVWVRPALVGDAGRGTVIHDYSKAPE